MTRNQEKFLTLMEHYGEATEYAKVAAESSGTALEKFNNSYLGSIQASQDAFKAQYEQLTNNILNGGLIKFTYDSSTGILGFFNSIIETFKAFPTLAATAMGVMSGVFDKNIVNVVDKEGSKFFGKGFDFSLFGLLDGNKLSKDVEVFDRIIGSIEGGSKPAKALRKEMDNLCDTNKKWAETLLDSKVGSKQMKTEITNMSESLNKMSISSKASAISMKALNLAMNIGIMLAVSTAISLVVKGLDNLIHSQEKAIEKSRELAESVKNLKDEISSMEEELKTTKDRIQELSNLDNPSFTEQSELDNLKIQNKELELQLELKRKLLEAEQKESNKAAVKAVKKHRSLTGQDIFEETYGDKQTVDEYKNKINDLQNKNKSLDTNSSEYKVNDRRIKDYQNSIDSYNATIVKNIALLNEQKGELTGTDEETVQLKQQIEDLINAWDKWDNTDKTDKFNKVLDSDKFKDIKEQVLGLNNLTGEDLQTNYPELVEDLKTVNISADEAAKQINSLNGKVSNTPDLFNNLSDVLSSFTENADLMKSVTDDMNKMGAISDNVLSQISSKYPDLAQSILQYKLGLLSVNDVYSLIQSKYSEDVANQEQALTKKLLNEQWFVDGIINGDQQMLDYLNQYYQGDVEQFTEYVKTKAEIEKVACQVMGDDWVTLQKGKENAEITMVEASIKRLEEQKNAAVTATKMALSLMGVNETVASQLLSKVTDPFDKKIDELKGNLKNIEGITIEPFDISSLQKYNNAINSSADKTSDEFSKAYNYLQYLRDKNIISEEEYLNRLYNINEQYNKNNLETWRKYDLEIYNGRQKLLEQQLKAEGEAYTKSIDKKIKKLQEQKDAETKYYDKKIKRLQEQKDAINDQTTEEDKLFKLQKAKKAWEDALSQKNTLVYKKNVGFEYDVDHEAVDKAKEDYDNAQKDYDNYQVIKEIDNKIKKYEQAKQSAIESIDKEISSWERLKENVSEQMSQIGASFEEHEENLALLVEAEKLSYNEMASAAENYASRVVAAMKRIEKAKAKAGSSKAKGYAEGTSFVPQSGVYNVNELGAEIIWRKPASGNLDYLQYGDEVIPASKSSGIMKNLMNLGNFNPLERITNKFNLNSYGLLNSIKPQTSTPSFDVNIGDINLQGVQDVNGLSNAIVNRLPSTLKQLLYKK